MKHSRYLIPALALLIAGCDAMSIESTESELDFTRSSHQSATATIIFEAPGEMIILENQPGIHEGNEHGWCHPGGVWENPGGNRSRTVPHPHCMVPGPGMQTIATLPAQYQVIGRAQAFVLRLNDSRNTDPGAPSDIARPEVTIQVQLHRNPNFNTLFGEGELTVNDHVFVLEQLYEAGAHIQGLPEELILESDAGVVASLTWELD